ncbi:MAG: cytochrome C, partial [Desulfuromonadales bacterium]|nr:cytochrome C [Desulfuromonadales bacterium]
RQMWLEVIVKDEKGKVILSTGAVEADGSLAKDARIFNSDGMGSDMHFAVDPWVITAFSRHETIPPKGYRDVHYGVTAPKGSKKLTIEAKLRYRQADQKIAEALLGAVPKDIDLARDYGLSKVPTLPVVDMVSLQREVAAAQ